MKLPYEETTKRHRVIIYGHPTLRRRADEVMVFDDSLREFAREMMATMDAYEGIGLAANQVDRAVRLLVIGLPDDDDESDDRHYLAIANPVIKQSSGTLDFEEGCLSIPEIRETVTRPETITVEFDTLNGERKTIEASGMLARVLQHEIDHLNGVLFIDHLSPIRRSLLSSKLKRLERESQES